MLDCVGDEPGDDDAEVFICEYGIRFWRHESLGSGLATDQGLEGNVQ